MRKALGGYLELELGRGKVVHNEALTINSGRNGLRYILQARKYDKIYLPYFTCDVVLTTIKEEGLVYEFYSIDINLEPIFDLTSLVDGEVFLYTNYFGVKDAYIKELVKEKNNYIIDNAQAFYSLPIEGIDTFYSPRKFLGVPDGGYVYCNSDLVVKDQDVSYERCAHLLKRLDIGAEAGYVDFCLNETVIDNLPLRRMSVLTNLLIDSLDHNYIRNKRRDNFSYLYEMFKGINKIDLPLDKDSVPLVFPLWVEKDIKEILHKNRCFTATYWPNVLEWVESETLEHRLVNSVVYLPIDQRVSREELNEIIDLL